MTEVLTTPEATTTDTGVAAPLHSNFLSAGHKAYFRERAIDPDFAQAYTVNGPDGLPEELKFHLKKGEDVVPALVFENMDIRGTITYQLRPDMKCDAWGKYLFMMGAFNGPYVHSTQLHLVGKLKKIAVIEGSAQLRAAITAAIADGSINEILFIGIPGCGGSWQNQHFSNDWNEIVPDVNPDNPKDAADIVMVFDADVASNIDVWKAADKLRRHLEITSGAKVRVADIPAYGTVGLDDWLSNMPAERRSRAFHGLLDAAPAKMPPRPAKTAARGNKEIDLPVMDFVRGVCKFPDTKNNGMVQPGRTILEAAVRIVRSYSEYNDLAEEANQTMRHDIEVTTRVTGELTTHVIPNVTDRMLSNPREWLNKIYGGAGSKLFIYSRDVETLDRTIRNVSEQELIEVIERSGLKADKDGTVRFMDTTGALGPDDKIVDLRAKIQESKMRKFRLEDPHNLSKAEIQEALRHLLNMWDVCVDPTAYLLMLGQTIAAVHGVAPKGTYGSFGDPSAGKTVIGEMNRSILGAHLDMANFEATPNAVGNLGAGVHHLPLFVDDFQDLSSGGLKAIENNNNGLRMMLRRGYGGAKYHKERMGQNKDTDKWENVESDPASPFFSVTMERKAIPYDMESGMKRMLLARVTRENSFATPDDATRAIEYSKSPLGARALAIVVLYVVQAIRANRQDLETWLDWQEHFRRQVQARLYEEFRGVLAEPRAYEVASTPVYGVDILVDIMYRYDVINEDERQARKDQVDELVMKASKEWQDSVTKKGGGMDGYLARLSDSVTAGAYLLADDWKSAYDAKDARSKVLGWHATYRGEDVVILVPSEAASICRVSADKLEGELAKYLVTDGSGNKKPAVPSKSAKSGKARLWALKLSAWENGTEEVFNATDHPDGGVDNTEF